MRSTDALESITTVACISGRSEAAVRKDADLGRLPVAGYKGGNERLITAFSAVQYAFKHALNFELPINPGPEAVSGLAVAVAKCSGPELARAYRAIDMFSLMVDDPARRELAEAVMKAVMRRWIISAPPVCSRSPQ